MQGHKAYTEKLFTSFQLSSRVPEHNFYRRLKAQLDLDFIRKHTRSYYGTEGQCSIDPVVFFKLILVGYLENVNSDRKIIDHCTMRLDIMYFLGYDIDEELPWHSTLSRTRQFNYSAQTVVDTASHVITNIVADYSDKRDSQSLPLAISQAKAQLQENGLQMQEVLADAAYSSGESLQYLEENNLTGYIPNFGQYKPTREGFTYNSEKDQYQCTQGHKATLPYRKTITDSKGYTKKIYRSDNSKCKNCPLRNQCIGKSDFKKIEDSIAKPYYDRMHQRLQTSKAKRMKKLRSSTVEPVLGTLINFMGMRRIWTRGIEGAGKFMLGAATAYNLKKWLNYMVTKAKTGAMIKLREELTQIEIHIIHQILLPLQLTKIFN